MSGHYLTLREKMRWHEDGSAQFFAGSRVVVAHPRSRIPGASKQHRDSDNWSNLEVNDFPVKGCLLNICPCRKVCRVNLVGSESLL